MAPLRAGCTLLAALLVALGACSGRSRQGATAPPPEESSRPTLRTRAALDPAPSEAGDRRVVASARTGVGDAVLTPAPDARGGDILLVNDASLTIAEVLFEMRAEIEARRSAHTREGFREHVERLLRRRTQQKVGGLLLYQKAMRGLNDAQVQALDKVVEQELSRMLARDYGGIRARLERELADFGLTYDQYREARRREIVVRQYARETLMPGVHVTRAELLRYYRQNAGEFFSPELRELWMIEAPFESFLPSGMTWERASAEVRSQARFAAVRHIRAAHAALSDRPFEEVAREYCRGPRAAEGGNWGLISRPLQSPYDESSRLAFEFSPGTISEPIETPRGWCIVRLGHVEAAREVSFAEAQERIRPQLMDAKFNEALGDYVMRLAERATITMMDAFIAEALRRAEAGLP